MHYQVLLAVVRVWLVASLLFSPNNPSKPTRPSSPQLSLSSSPASLSFVVLTVVAGSFCAKLSYPVPIKKLIHTIAVIIENRFIIPPFLCADTLQSAYHVGKWLVRHEIST